MSAPTENFRNIDIKGQGPTSAGIHRLRLGDLDLSAPGVSVIGLTFRASHGAVNQLTLELECVPVDIEAGAVVEVEVSESLRDALAAAGWTPPGGAA